MKIIKSILSFITLSVLTAILLFIMLNYQNIHTTDQETKNTNNTYTQATSTQSIVQPIRKTYDEDYALRLMSVPRKNITDINVISDYDKTLSKLQYNVNNNVATFKDKEILRVYYNIKEEENNDWKEMY